MHYHERPPVPDGQRLPVFVVISRSMRLVVYEGMPEFEALKALIEDLLGGDPGASPSATPAGGK